MAHTQVPNRVTDGLLTAFEGVRRRLFGRLEGLTDAEYLWEPAGDSLTIQRRVDGTYGVDALFPATVPGQPAPVTTIAWRIMHIGAGCLRGYVIHFFEDVPDPGDRLSWPGTAPEGVQALANDWERFVTHLASLGDRGLLTPMGRGPDGWAEKNYLTLALHALDEVAHHGGEIGLMRDLHLRTRR